MWLLLCFQSNCVVLWYEALICSTGSLYQLSRTPMPLLRAQPALSLILVLSEHFGFCACLCARFATLQNAEATMVRASMAPFADQKRMWERLAVSGGRRPRKVSSP